MQERQGYSPAELGQSARSKLVETWTRRYTIELHRVDNASFEKGSQLNSEDKWGEAAQVYYTIWREAPNPRDRAEGAIQLSQMLINKGAFAQARGILNELAVLVPERAADRRDQVFRAKILGKLGWIADYEGDFAVAQDIFSTVRHLIGTSTNEDEEGVYSNATHFLGRATLCQARRVRNQKMRTAGIEAAQRLFLIDLARFERLRAEGRPSPENEAFQHAWLARCAIEVDKLEEARIQIDSAERLFKEAKPEKEKFGHIENLRGALQMKQGDIKGARKRFEVGLGLWEGGEYRKGRADSFAAIAFTYWAERKVSSAFVYGYRAVNIFPPILLRGVV